MSHLPRITFWRVLATLLILSGLVAAILRFKLGLGATTNLSDAFPWGLWIGFDFIGIGLAAAGFTIVAAVHIFHAREYEPIVRPAVLTAFIGYLLVVLVLVIDLGRPEHFWHPLVMWNPHSVMFEITWCLILYTTVLSLEFAPIVAEKFGFHHRVQWLHTFSLPFMILGVILSTLHQSSFGSLYLIVPNRLHALWYTPLLPVLFFVSCLASGLSMVIIQTLVLSRHRPAILSPKLLGHLGKLIAVILALYLVVRLQDMYTRGAFRGLEPFGYHSLAFYSEILVGFVAPLVLLMSDRIRHSRRGLYAACLMVLAGFAANRMNTAVTGLERWPAQTYVPSIPEVLITLGIAAAGFSAFFLLANYLPIFNAAPHGKPDPESAGGDLAGPTSPAV